MRRMKLDWKRISLK